MHSDFVEDDEYQMVTHSQSRMTSPLFRSRRESITKPAIVAQDNKARETLYLEN